MRLNTGIERIVINNPIEWSLGIGVINSLLLANDVSHFARKHEQGYYFATTVLKDRLRFTLRYEKSNGYSLISGISTTVTSIVAMLGYRFYQNY